MRRGNRQKQGVTGEISRRSWGNSYDTLMVIETDKSRHDQLTPAQLPGALPLVFQDWFADKGWRPRSHQLDLLRRAQQGGSTLLIAPTGAGKTLAGFLPALTELSGEERQE